MKPKPKKEFLTRRRWKHCVQALSCLVVFCTVYMLILPVITLEAKSYCGKEEHSHSPDCFIEIDQCGLIEHEHDEFCYDDEGSLVCPLDEHIHDDSCYDRILDCGKTEHKHELICFSNPEADLDKPENWEKKIDEIKTDNPDFTKRELITAIAKSQEGQKESLDNYKVQDETVKKGISRYGIWDDDPYEDWSGAFARFVLSYSGFEDELTTYPKDTDEWLEQLNKEEKLLPVLDGKQGDVLFAYTEQDELKAGIITDNNDDRITAIMGDWQDKVSRQTFQIDDSNLHSIFKITPDDPDKDQKDSEDENSSDDQFDNSDQASDPDQNKDQSSSSEDSNDNPAGPADFTESNGKFNSSFNDTSDEDTSKDDDNKTSQSNENSNDPDGKESDEKDVTDNLKDKSEDSSDSTGKEESDKSDKTDPADDSSSSEKDSSENSSGNSESESDSEDSSDKEPTDDSQEPGEEESDKDENEKNAEADGTENSDDSKKNETSKVLTAKADDGSLIKAEFDKEALPENAVLMAKRLKNGSKELDKLDAKVKEKFKDDLEENSLVNYIAYDIFFGLSDGNELQEIEPKKPVHISILLEEKIESKNSKLVHLKDNGTLEDLTDQKNSYLYEDAKSALDKKPWLDEKSSKDAEKEDPDQEETKTDSKQTETDKDTQTQTGKISLVKKEKANTQYKAASSSRTVDQPDPGQFESMIEFDSSSFSTIAYVDFPGSGYITVDNAAALYNAVYDHNSSYIKLTENIDLQSGGQKKAVYIDNRTVVIDMNGHFIKNEVAGNGQNIFVIKNHGNLTLTNKLIISDSSSNRSETAHWQSKNNNGEEGWIQYWEDNNHADANAGSETKKMVTNVGVLYAPNNTAVLIESTGGTFTMEKNAIVDSSGGIDSNNGTVKLNDAYIIGDPTKNTTALKTTNGSLQMNGGAIAGHKKWGGEAGAAIHSNGTEIILSDGAKIVNNACFDLNETFGGAIALKGYSKMIINQATIAYNLLNIGNDNTSATPRWTGGAGIGVMGNSELTINNGALIDNNKSWMLGGGICMASDGKDRKSQVANQNEYNAASKLYMYGGTISNNVAHHREGGGLALAADHWNYAYLYGGVFENNKTETTQDWGGGGIFVGMYSYLVMPNGASVYGNEAKGYGGGIAGCSTGRLFMDEKVTMVNNTGIGEKFTGDASSKDEPAFTFDQRFKEYGGANDFFGCLHSMVSGKFWNGNESAIGAAWNGSADGIRLSDINDGYVMANELLGLSSNVKDSDTIKTVTNHGVIITNNKSSIHGGGILVNGYMIGGDVEKLYVGDTFGLAADKSYVDENGNAQSIANGQFEFEVLNNMFERVSYGTSNADGMISFNNRVVFDSEPSENTFTFYVREISPVNSTGSPDSINIQYDGTVYRLKVNITDELLNSFIIYRKDQDGNLNPVTLQERQIKINSISVDKGILGSDNQFSVTEVNWKTFSYNNESDKIVDLKKDDSKTFSNKMISKRKLEVNKVWADGKPHSNEPVQVDLYKKYTGESDDQGVKLDNQSKTLSAANDWKAEWSDLPTHDQNGWIEYFVRENLPNDLYIPEYSTEFKSYDIPSTIQVTGPVWVPINSGNTKLGSENVLISDNRYAVNSSEGAYVLNSVRIDSSKAVTLADGTEGYLVDAVLQSEKVKHRDYEFAGSSDRGAIQFNDSTEKYLSYGQYGTNGSFELNVRGTGDHYNNSYPYKLSSSRVMFKKRGTNDWVYLTETNGTFGVTGSQSEANVSAYELQTRTYNVADTTTAYLQKVTITNTPNQQAMFGLNIKKVSGEESEKDKPLPGAKFKISKDSQEMKFTLKDGTYQMDPDGTEVILTSNQDGLINVSGLSAGTYKISEVEAPVGYMIDQENSVKEIVIDAEHLVQPGNLTFEIEIKNKLMYYELPETGGSGTQWLSYGGLMLMAGSGLYLTRQAKRRKAGG